MKKKIVSLALLISSELFAVSNCSFTDELVEYNGHYYGITSNIMEFDEAKAFAEQYGGYLAIPNSSAENNMLKGLVGGGDGAWIGVYDSSMSTSYCFITGDSSCVSPSRFKDIKGNNLTYSNWSSFEPNNFVQPYDVVDGKQMVSPLGEHWTVMNGNNGQWYDDGNHINSLNNPVRYRALLEFDSAPSCFQAESTVSDEWTTKMCNTQIWDSTTGNVETGTTLNCQKDKYNNDYCPSALAPASENWDYENGYSVSGVGQVVDYTKIEAVSNNVVSGTANFNYSASFCTDHFTKVILVPDGNDVHFILVAQHPGGGTDGRCGYRDYSSSWLQSKGIVGWNVPTAFKRINIVTFANPVYSVEGFKFTFSSYGRGCSNVSGSGTGNTSRSSSDPYAYGYAFDNQSLTNCGANSAQTPTVNINFSSIYTRTLNCPDGYTETTGTETAKGECKKTIEYTYYNYLCNSNKNTQGYDYKPTNSGGNCTPTSTDDLIDTNGDGIGDSCNSSTPPTNNCSREKFLCQYNEERPPVWVDNQWMCSPFPCYGEESTEVAGTVEGTNDKNNDGWSSDGSCMGQIYIFNGNDKRCRYWDMFFGLMGGGCCDKDKVFMGLIQCKENEKILAKKNKANLCHKVGTYCSKKLKLGFIKICVQKSESHCCFSSKIARAIHEQGRPQLGIDWGSGDSPQCRGFTPEEFQKLDFSKIDLSGEFDIPDLDTSKLSNTLNNAVTNLQNMLGN